MTVCVTVCVTGSSDFELLSPISIYINGYYPSTDIRLFIINDETALEYDDRVLLRFTPGSAELIPGLASYFNEYIRDTAVVNIIDINCKCSSHLTTSLQQ